MKRKTRKILMVLAMATISAFGVLFASCGAGDWLNEKVDQLTCKHEYDDGIELESATCSEYGKVLKTCTICYYEKTEKINKLPHTETVVAAEAPTCTKDGKTDGVVCSVCDEIIVRQKSVPKLGHDITILEAVEPTCLTSGKTEGKYCNRCNETVVEQKTIPALGHKVTTTYGKAATCTESGLTNGQACARCATVYVAQEVIPVMGHTFEDGECNVCGCYDVSAIAAMNNLDLVALSDEFISFDVVYCIPLSELSSSNGLYICCTPIVKNVDRYECEDICRFLLRWNDECTTIINSFLLESSFNAFDKSLSDMVELSVTLENPVANYAFSSDGEYLFIQFNDFSCEDVDFVFDSWRFMDFEMIKMVQL